ncbi:hypothetical protein PFICI_10907 [Pestalotiopsis fici W106-1]|uniref:ATPase AAA-type core domain-containing protein n=1 Tax=Pestalotiopsis fici (strain W106-1 / CGMCC3.15140) TaxID=1229662 RepID=W3WT30_PESFW|nr:uncharacterized protein PFICI_10907 [Pestalotiopsis fici W106-1]ETS77033.1 hypothetical protein PFICI_10907 [Pestalotiopsis fici W106-1]
MSKSTKTEIEQVIAAQPTCTRREARSLLKICDNDVAKAIARYKLLDAYKDTEETASGTDSESEAPSSETDKDSNHDSEDSETVNYDEDDEESYWPALPRFDKPAELIKGGADGSGVFELESLIGFIQGGATDTQVQAYLDYYDEDIVQENMNALIGGEYPAIFYVVETHNVKLIRLWVKYGGDPNITCGEDKIPLLVFAILRGSRTLQTVTKTVETLLVLGALPSSIPAAFYQRYDEDLPEEGPDRSKMRDLGDENKKWCTPDFSTVMSAALNVTMRYFLDRASKFIQPSGREKTVVFRQNAEGVLGLYQSIIAQPVATRWLMRKLLSHLSRQSNKPLVLVFAGPSGHGKTELAKSLGSLLGVEMKPVNCTVMNNETDLFGARPPMSDWAKGSPVNNFIVEQHEKRSVIFMDEFEKTEQQVHNSLLIPFQEGTYEDRRDAKLVVDCKKTIWILATNAFDNMIHSFHEKNKAGLESDDVNEQERLVNELCQQLRRESISKWGAPLTGRIKTFMPFLRFSDAESIIVAHKGFMDYEAEVAKPIVLAKDPKHDRYIGNVRIAVKNDSSLFSRLSKENYIPETGARGIFDGVERELIDPLTEMYLKDGEDFDEDQPETLFEIGMGRDKEVEVKLIRQRREKVDKEQEEEEDEEGDVDSEEEEEDEEVEIVEIEDAE